MADKKISQLNEVINPNNTDFLPVVNAGLTKKVTLDNLVQQSTYSTNNIGSLTLQSNLNSTDQVPIATGTGLPRKVPGSVFASSTQVQTLTGILDTKILSVSSVTATGTLSARTLQDRFADVINVKDFGAKGDGITDDTTAIQAALNTIITQNGGTVFVPVGTYIINRRLVMPSNACLYGEHKSTTIIKAANTISTSLSSMIDMYNTNYSKVENLTLDGNRSNRIGIPSWAGVGIYLRRFVDTLCAYNTIQNVQIINNPLHGILIEGFFNGVLDVKVVERTRILDCEIFNNGGVGLGQFKAFNSLIHGNIFGGNDWENLTIDVNSNACTVTNNRFFRANGGCGNIGWDVGNFCIFSNNFIDCENNTANPDISLRNGICINSQVDVTSNFLISNNVILKANNCGVVIKNRVGEDAPDNPPFVFTGFAAGNGVIQGNIFSENGTDISVEEGAGPVIITGNKYNTINTNKQDGSQVRLGAGDITFVGTLSSGHSITFTPGDLTWKKVPIGTLKNSRLTTLSGNEINVPVGGVYTINASVRIENLSATNPNWVSAAIRYTDKNLVTSDLVWYNVDPRPQVFPSNTTEISFSTTQLISAGNIGLYIRGSVNSTANVQISAFNTTLLTGALQG